MPKRLQYPIVVEGSSNTQAKERSQVDKWLGSAEPPQSNWSTARTAACVVALAPALAFVGPPTGSTFPERTQPDKYVSTSALPVWGVPQRQHLAPTLAGPISPTFTERSQVDKWFRETERPRFDLARAQYSYPSFAGPVSATFTEAAGLDKWFKETERPRWDVARAQHTYPSHSGPVSGTFPETTQPDKYAQPAQLPPTRTAGIAYLTPASPGPSTISTAEIITISKWYVAPQPVPASIARLQYLSLPATVAPVSPTFAERAQLDKWGPSYPDRVPDTARQQHTYTAQPAGPISTTASSAAPLAWLRVDVQVFAGTPRAIQPGTVGPVSSRFTETTQPDKWAPRYPDLLFVRFYPTYLLPPQAAAAAVPITLTPNVRTTGTLYYL